MSFLTIHAMLTEVRSCPQICMLSYTRVPASEFSTAAFGKFSDIFKEGIVRSSLYTVQGVISYAAQISSRNGAEIVKDPSPIW
jgi:hypothetical protein